MQSARKSADQWRDYRSAIRRTGDGIARIVLLLLVVVAIWIAMAQVTVPPALVPASAPATTFSGERAIAHLRVIASQPHAVGSPAQTMVRDYIVQQIRALGLAPVIQDATAALTGESGVFASHLQNILVRIPGADSTGAVALMAHYDSQPNTPGASDNGAAVAGLLESMRAIQTGPQPRNDLIFILADAEEVNSQGADAFFSQHPWAKDIQLLLNFDATGDSGPSLLLETAPKNRALVQGFARGAPHPVAYSFMTQLLTVMPLGTDTTVFGRNDAPALTPVFGWHYRTMYHSMLDTTRKVDPRSVQQEGENALGLARYFGNQDLQALGASDAAVFFSLLPGIIVQYSAAWATPLAVLAALLLAGVVIAGYIRHRLALRGILAGIAIALAGILIPVILAVAGWMAVARLHPEYWRNLMGAPYRADVYLLGFVALVAAASLAIFLLARRKVTVVHLTAGALLIWLMLALLTSYAVPGMSYLFTWPTIVTTLMLAGLVLKSAPAGNGGAVSRRWLAGLSIAAAAIILLIIPVFFLMYTLTGFWFATVRPAAPFIAVPMLFLALSFGLLAPQIDLLPRTRAWLAPAIAVVLAITFLAFASLESGFSASQPLQNGVWYEMDADSGQAAWYSFGAKPNDPWTAQFFPGAIEPVQLAGVYAVTPGNPAPANAFKGAAPVAPLRAPDLTVLSDQTTGDVRTIRLNITSPRFARGLRVKVSGAPVLAAAVNGNRQADGAWQDRGDWFLRYYGMTSSGVDLVLEVRPSHDVALVVADQSDGLPNLPGVTYTARLVNMMPFAIAQEYMPYPETTSVSKTFRLP